jgi:hypothetical protein
MYESQVTERTYDRQVDQIPLDREQALPRDAEPSQKPLTAEGEINFIQETIAACNMNTESDAELALKISNALTQALLEHRQNMLHEQGKSDPALERHLVDLRAQNAELAQSSTKSESSRMQAALNAALRLATNLASDRSQDTIHEAMSVLDAVNKKLYGMIDPGTAASSGGTKPEVKQDEQKFVVTQKNTASASSLLSSSSQKPVLPAAKDESPSASVSVASQPAPSPAKRFRFGL